MFLSATLFPILLFVASASKRPLHSATLDNPDAISLMQLPQSLRALIYLHRPGFIFANPSVCTEWFEAREHILRNLDPAREKPFLVDVLPKAFQYIQRDSRVNDWRTRFVRLFQSLAISGVSVNICTQLARLLLNDTNLRTINYAYVNGVVINLCSHGNCWSSFLIPAFIFLLPYRDAALIVSRLAQSVIDSGDFSPRRYAFQTAVLSWYRYSQSLQGTRAALLYESCAHRGISESDIRNMKSSNDETFRVLRDLMSDLEQINDI